MEPRKKKKSTWWQSNSVITTNKQTKKPAESDSVVFLKNAPGDSPQVKQV